jgi:regulator of nucleoside diphosphate kinase
MWAMNMYALVGVSAGVIVALIGWTLARYVGRSTELNPALDQGEIMHRTVRVTDFDSRQLQNVVASSLSKDPQDLGSVERLERRLDDVEIIRADRIEPDIVTMNSEVRISDLDTHETIVFRLVFPNAADATAGKISVLAPMGMAVLGRAEGDHVSWETPGGMRRLRVDQVLYQPEREGVDVGAVVSA